MTAEGVEEFMIEEYRVLNRRAQSSGTNVTAKANLFLGLSGGAFVVVSSFGPESDPDRTAALAVMGALVGLFGLVVIREQLLHGLEVTTLYRRAGRIRCWFHDQDPSIYDYLPWAPGDDTPPFDDARAFRTFPGPDPIMAMVTLSALGGASYFGSSLAIDTTWVRVCAGAGGVVAGGLVAALQASSLKATQERLGGAPYNSHFPVQDRLSVRDRSFHGR